MRFYLIALLAVFPLLTACDSTTDSSTSRDTAGIAPITERTWEAFRDEVIEDMLAEDPVMAVEQGRHEYDGKLRNYSLQALDAYVQQAQIWIKEANGFSAEQLTVEQHFERDYLIAELEEEIFWIAEAKFPQRSPLWYALNLSPDLYISVPYADLATRFAAYITYTGNLPQALRQMRENLQTPLPRTYVETASAIFKGLTGFMSTTVPETFASVDDPELQQKFLQSNDVAIAAVQETSEWFDRQLENANEDFALGEKLYRRMLWTTERVDISLDDLKAIGVADLERNLAALTEVCAHYLPESDNKACIEKAEANKPEDSAVLEARRQLVTLKQFLVDKDIVSILGTEEALVEEAPPHRRFNLAYINIPGPYETGLPSVYYIAPPDPAWTEEEQQAYISGKASLLFVSVHEVWPGHFLNFLHANRADSLFGRLFIGYAFAEGWAHYTEELMWVKGLNDGDPETHIGQLRNALLRNVRFLSSIGMHTEGMSVEESFALFQEKGFQDPGNARQQAYRGTFDPGYLNYTMGKLMIIKLRDDWAKNRGGETVWKDFHDEFLSYGGPPIPMVREAMVGKEGKLFAVPDQP